MSVCAMETVRWPEHHTMQSVILYLDLGRMVPQMCDVARLYSLNCRLTHVVAFQPPHSPHHWAVVFTLSACGGFLPATHRPEQQHLLHSVGFPQWRAESPMSRGDQLVFVMRGHRTRAWMSKVLSCQSVLACLRRPHMLARAKNVSWLEESPSPQVPSAARCNCLVIRVLLMSDDSDVVEFRK